MRSIAYVFFLKQMQECQSELQHSWKIVLLVLMQLHLLHVSTPIKLVCCVKLLVWYLMKKYTKWTRLSSGGEKRG